MNIQQNQSRQQVQLPPQLQSLPGNVIGVFTTEQIGFMVRENMLTLEGAYYLLPPQVWKELPKPMPKQVKQWSWLNLLRQG